MELKTKYQYKYFIYPYIIKESKYSKYILKLLKNKKLRTKIFQKEKELDIYRYLLPKVRDYMFNSFNIEKSEATSFEKLNINEKVKILSKQPSVVFEYELEKDIQGKTEKNEGIYFKIQKIEIICFNTGICFLCMKTNIEDSKEFANILNFNYKFRDISQEYNNLNNYDNIYVQTDSFDNTKKIAEFIKEITGSNIETMKYGNLNPERFLTYSYICIDQENWNVNTQFEDINNYFTKYINILPNDDSINFNNKNVKIISKWKYAKLGITKSGMALFSSTADINNYTKLALEYETQYLYTYIFAIYEQIYLKKIDIEFKEGRNIKQSRKQFIEFTKNLWVQEITQDDIGTIIYNGIKNVIELEELYNKISNKYNILYKELNIEKYNKVNNVLVVILITSLLFNIVNFILLINK